MLSSCLCDTIDIRQQDLHCKRVWTLSPNIMTQEQSHKSQTQYLPWDFLHHWQQFRWAVHMLHAMQEMSQRSMNACYQVLPAMAAVTAAGAARLTVGTAAGMPRDEDGGAKEMWGWVTAVALGN